MQQYNTTIIVQHNTSIIVHQATSVTARQNIFTPNVITRAD
jgi:hypothetical protein